MVWDGAFAWSAWSVECVKRARGPSVAAAIEAFCLTGPPCRVVAANPASAAGFAASGGDEPTDASSASADARPARRCTTGTAPGGFSGLADVGPVRPPPGREVIRSEIGIAVVASDAPAAFAPVCVADRCGAIVSATRDSGSPDAASLPSWTSIGAVGSTSAIPGTKGGGADRVAASDLSRSASDRLRCTERRKTSRSDDAAGRASTGRSAMETASPGSGANSPSCGFARKGFVLSSSARPAARDRAERASAGLNSGTPGRVSLSSCGDHASAWSPTGAKR